MNEHEDLRKVVQAFETLQETIITNDMDEEELIGDYIPGILDNYFAELKNKLEIEDE